MRRSTTCWSAGKWRTDRARGARRIRQSGDRASVARFARIMLRRSKASAGAYSATLDHLGDRRRRHGRGHAERDRRSRKAGRGAPGHAGDVRGRTGQRGDR